MVVFSIAVVALLGLGQVAAARIGDSGRAQAANACANTVAETLLAARATARLGIGAYPSSFDGACTSLALTYTDAIGGSQTVRPLQSLAVPSGMNCTLQIGEVTTVACTTDGVSCRRVEAVVGIGAVPLARVVVVLAGYVEG
jgi:hypothetical protein